MFDAYCTVQVQCVHDEKSVRNERMSVLSSKSTKDDDVACTGIHSFLPDVYMTLAIILAS